MVFFICNSCGSCIKKPAVEKHIYQCRNYGSLSCMDCNKDFYGDSYKAHTKCITELEKYSGEGWKAPAGHNKGEKKQGAWMDTVMATVEKAGKNAPPAVKSLLQSLTRHDNVPRKKPKFLNFIKNIARNHFDNGTIESVWTLLEAQWKLEREAQTQSQNGNPKPKDTSDAIQHNDNDTNGIEADEEAAEEPPRKKKKKKHKEINETCVKNEEENTLEENVVENSEASPVKKKKKHKKKKAEDCDAEAEPVNEEILTEATEETPPVKKSKKHKKRHADEQLVEESNAPFLEEAIESEVHNQEKSKKKKKEKVHVDS